MSHGYSIPRDFRACGCRAPRSRHLGHRIFEFKVYRGLGFNGLGVLDLEFRGFRGFRV